MIRRETWIALVILLGLVGLSILLRDQRTKTAEAATPTEGLSPLLSGGLGAPSLIRIESALGQAVQLGRNAAGTWVLELPEEAAADQAGAQAAATQIGALRILSTVDLSPEIIGLDAPAYILTLEFDDGSKHTLLVGSVTPITDGYYAQLDGGPFQVVDKYGLDELIGLVAAPPYLATPTPAETPSAVPSATLLSASAQPAGSGAMETAVLPQPSGTTATP